MSSLATEAVKRLLEDDEAAKDFLMGMPMPETPHEVIRRVYGTLDFLDVSTEAAKKRAGTSHEERWVHGFADVWHCRVCGWVAVGLADPEFHPEVYL